MKKFFALLICAVLAIGCLAGCTGGDTSTASKAESSKAESSKAESSKSDASQAEASQADVPGGNPGEEATYPLVADPITLSYYIRINGAMSATMETYADVEFFKFQEERTNVKIEWDHNTSDENFSMILASSVYPDMINWNLGNAPGGAQALIEDGVILDLTELIPKYAPAYYEWMQNNPEEDQAFKLEGGIMFQFANFNADIDTKDIKYFKIYGPQIRKDWLDKVGKAIPTTTDQLYDVLVAFRDNDMDGDGDPSNEIPYVMGKAINDARGMSGAFGARFDMQKSLDGKVEYGPITENYKKFVTFMHKLYSEGLINSDFAVDDDAMSKITQNKAGFAISSMGSSLIANHDNLKLQDPTFDYVSVPWLIGPDGYQFDTEDQNKNPRATGITSTNKYVEVTLRWLDYAYTDEGAMLSTFGIEGESFEIIDGYPTITEKAKTSDKGWSEEQCMARWMLGPINYPNARDYRFYEQVNLNEDYKIQIQTDWNKAKDGLTLPPYVMTTEEAATYSGIMADVKTYMETTYLEFVVGDKDIDAEWDNYVNTIESMGIAEAVQCAQDAYDRYMSR